MALSPSEEVEKLNTPLLPMTWRFGKLATLKVSYRKPW